MTRIRRRKEANDQASPPRVWKVGKYIRLSRDDGNSESESIGNQRKILDQQIPGYFHGDYEIVREYIDDGRTGTSDDTRPEFLQLVEDVKKGKINCIITKNLSRAFRNSANQGKFLEEFIPLYNTRFISLYEPCIDTFLNPEVVHSLEVSITGFMNEQYAYKTSVDVRRTLDTKRKKGEFIGAFAPYGYQKKPEDKNSLMIDEEAASVVREIFRWYVEEGMSKNGIARRLNELGASNPTLYKRRHGLLYCNPQGFQNDGLWSEKTVSNILLNEVYIGNMVQGKQKVISYKIHDRVMTDEQDWYIVENTHEAVVDKETFQKAQFLHQRDTRAAPAQKTVHLFSGFLRCADCGKGMTRKTAKGIAYYCCSTYSRKSKTACTRHSIREDAVERAVLLAIQRQISLIPNLTEMIEEIQADATANTQFNQAERLLAARKKNLEKLKAAADNLYIDWRAGEISADAYRRLKEKCEAQERRLRETVAHLEKEKLEAAAHKKEPFSTAFLRLKNISCLERGILAELVNFVEVHEGGGLTIHFTFADPMKNSCLEGP